MQVIAVGDNKHDESTPHQQQQSEKTRKNGRMCVVVGSLFTLTWTLVQLFIVLLPLGLFSAPPTLLPTLTLLCVLNSCINPLIYGLMWQPLRQLRKQASVQCSKSSLSRHTVENVSIWTENSIVHSLIEWYKVYWIVPDCCGRLLITAMVIFVLTQIIRSRVFRTRIKVIDVQTATACSAASQLTTSAV